MLRPSADDILEDDILEDDIVSSYWARAISNSSMPGLGTGSVAGQIHELVH